MKRFLENDIKILSVPLAIMATVVILTLISGKIIFDNIGRLNSELSDNSAAQDMLQTKLNSLQTINNQIGNSSEIVINALPGSNSILTTISELQTSALPLGLVLSAFRSSTLSLNPNNPVISTEMDFNADGAYDSISEFIKTQKDVAPITRFDSIRINNQNSEGAENLYRFSAILIAYWAPLPLKIPAIDEPLLKLTPDEEVILKKVTSLKAPSFLTSFSTASSSGTFGKSDPFGE